MKCRLQPCETCPYRRDVPSGVWAWHEYAKLADYDKPTARQPVAWFGCHTNPELVCHGWAVTHGANPKRGHELLSLRLAAVLGDPLDAIPAPTVPLFTSGAAAAAHGMRSIENPDRKARRAIQGIVKYRAARKRRRKP